MRVISREPVISRSELFRRGRQVAVAISLALSIAACGGGGGGGGGGQPSAPAQPPPTTNPPPANAAPTVEAGTDQTIEWPTATAQLTGSATDDASTATLTYSWSATSGPSGVTFGTANAAATSVTFPAAGTYVLQLAASDGSLSGNDTVTVTVSPAVYPASDTANSDPTNHGWTVAAPADVGMDAALLAQAATYAQTSGTAQPGSAGMIVRKGRLVHSWGNIDNTRFDLKSTTKSIGGMALGLAFDNNSLLPTDTAASKLPDFGANPPTNVTTGWLPGITIQQLATHTGGFEKEQAYPRLVEQPGTAFVYSDGGLNWLADVLTATFNADLATVLDTNVWTALGVTSSAGGPGNNGPANSDVHWRDNRSGRANPTNRELASGMFANVNTMARVGQLFLRKGVWANDQRILSEDFVSKVQTPVAGNTTLPVRGPVPADYPNASAHYGLLWWTNADGQLPNVPRDAYWAWGLGDSLIVVIPSLDIVAVRAGAQAPALSSVGTRVWNDDDWNGDYSVLAPFLDPIVQSVAQ